LLTSSLLPGDFFLFEWDEGAKSSRVACGKACEFSFFAGVVVVVAVELLTSFLPESFVLLPLFLCG